MKKLKNLLLIFVSALLISGCVEYNVKVKVNKDGSGTVRETVILGKGLVEMLRAFAEWGDEGEEFDLYDEDDLRRQAYEYGEDVEFVEGEKIHDRGREGYTATFRFNDITKLRIEDDPDRKVSSDLLLEEAAEEEPITFGFDEGDHSTITINLPGEFDPEDFDFDFDEEDVETENREEFEDMLKDLRISIKIEVNGDILETNAAYVDGSEITLIQLDMGEILDDPEQFEYLRNKKPQSKDEVRELLEEIPGLKVELENKVDIKFK